MDRSVMRNQAGGTNSVGLAGGLLAGAGLAGGGAGLVVGSAAAGGAVLRVASGDSLVDVMTTRRVASPSGTSLSRSPAAVGPKRWPPRLPPSACSEGRAAGREAAGDDAGGADSAGAEAAGW